MIVSKRPDVDRLLDHPPSDLRAVVVHGRDRGGVRERADRLAARVARDPDDPFDVAQLTEADLLDDPARLVDELCALSMMGGRRLVRLRLTGEKASVDKAAGEALAAHAEGAYNPDALFLVEAGALERGSTLRKAAEASPAAAAVSVYEDEAGDVARMVREGLAADRVALTREALDLLVARLPKERGVVRQEVERLALYLGPGARDVGPADLESFLGVEPEASLFDAAAHAYGGRLREAHQGLRRAYAEGEGGPAAVRALGQHAAKLRKALALVAGGREPATAAKASGVFWKAEREFVRQLGRWRFADLDALQPELLEADRACKSTGSPDALLAERAFMGVAGRARRLGL